MRFWYAYYSCIFYRYSDRVKVETERLNHLELDDLEVPSDTYLISCILEVSLCAKMHLKLQMDEEEKYNRKLESGLYTLQVCLGD